MKKLFTERHGQARPRVAEVLQEEVEARDQFLLLVDRTTKKDMLGGSALEDALRWRALGLNADWAKRMARPQ